MFTDTYVAYRFETWGPDISKILDNLKNPQQTTTTNKQQPPKIMKIIIRGGGGGGVLCSCKKRGRTHNDKSLFRRRLMNNYEIQ